MYVETSNQLSGRVATIQTAILDHKATQGKKLCLSFYYHMFGHTMGDFNIHVDVPGDGVITKHFELKGNQKQLDWKLGRFAFDTPQKPFKVGDVKSTKSPNVHLTSTKNQELYLSTTFSFIISTISTNRLYSKGQHHSVTLVISV